MHENEPMPPELTHPNPLAERVGQLVQDYLSPPLFSLGSMGSGSAMEDERVERWRTELGRRAADLWRTAAHRDPAAVRVVELVQVGLGYRPGSSVVPTSPGQGLLGGA